MKVGENSITIVDESNEQHRKIRQTLEETRNAIAHTCVSMLIAFFKFGTGRMLQIPSKHKLCTNPRVSVVQGPGRSLLGADSDVSLLELVTLTPLVHDMSSEICTCG